MKSRMKMFAGTTIAVGVIITFLINLIDLGGNDHHFNVEFALNLLLRDFTGSDNHPEYMKMPWWLYFCFLTAIGLLLWVAVQLVQEFCCEQPTYIEPTADELRAELKRLQRLPNKGRRIVEPMEVVAPPPEMSTDNMYNQIYDSDTVKQMSNRARRKGKAKRVSNF